MRIGINDHIDGTQRTTGAATGAGDPVNAARAAGARAWAGTDARLERLRSRLDHPRRVLVRDFVIFELKLLLDSLKSLLITQVAIAAFIIDLVRPGGRDYKVFYRVMDFGERLDQWLSLYGATRHAAEDPEGLMGESREGSPTMLGQLEHVVHRVVVGDHADGGELYPRTRGTQTAGADSTAAPQTQAQTSTGTNRNASTEPGTSANTGTSSEPSSPGAGSPREPGRHSTFEAENYGGRGPG